jgi:hypothetical protein
MHDVGHERPKWILVGVSARQAERHPGQTVVRTVKRDQVARTLSPRAREFDRVLDGLGPGIGQMNLGVRVRGRLGGEQAHQVVGECRAPG